MHAFKLVCNTRIVQLYHGSTPRAPRLLAYPERLVSPPMHRREMSDGVVRKTVTNAKRVADVMVPLVDTRSCGALEVCRLCAVCSTLHVAGNNEDLWQQLLFCAFPNCSKLRDYGVFEMRGHRWMYVQRSRRMPQALSLPPPPPPPKISPSDLLLLIDVYHGEQEHASLAVEGEELAELLRTSGVKFELPEARPVGKFVPCFAEPHDDLHHVDYDQRSGMLTDAWINESPDVDLLVFESWRLVAHFVYVGEGERHGKVVCVHDVRNGELDAPIGRKGDDWFCHQDTPVEKKKLDLDQGHAWTVGMGTSPAIYIDDPELLRRMPDLESFGILLEPHLVLPRPPRWYAYEAINALPTQCTSMEAGGRKQWLISTWMELSEDERERACTAAQKAVNEDGQNQIWLKWLGITFWYNGINGQSSRYSDHNTNGVTLLHLVEALQWN